LTASIPCSLVKRKRSPAQALFARTFGQVLPFLTHWAHVAPVESHVRVYSVIFFSNSASASDWRMPARE